SWMSRTAWWPFPGARWRWWSGTERLPPDVPDVPDASADRIHPGPHGARAPDRGFLTEGVLPFTHSLSPSVGGAFDASACGS
ncbi:MAG: hypothetical protein ACP5QO_13235, partial [Clostridia bacterium]